MGSVCNDAVIPLMHQYWFVQLGSAQLAFLCASAAGRTSAACVASTSALLSLNTVCMRARTVSTHCENSSEPEPGPEPVVEEVAEVGLELECSAGVEAALLCSAELAVGSLAPLPAADSRGLSVAGGNMGGRTVMMR